ncbi:MAG: energy transducer TonB [Brevundimonas sp.]|nr:MAG: energy transducer TonB [Brevundimonas sp.]
MLAMRQGVEEGRVKLQCNATPAGDLRDCRVVEEEPANAGFGEAALRGAQSAQIHPVLSMVSPFRRSFDSIFAFGWPTRPHQLSLLAHCSGPDNSGGMGRDRRLQKRAVGAAAHALWGLAALWVASAHPASAQVAKPPPPVASTPPVDAPAAMAPDVSPQARSAPDVGTQVQANDTPEVLAARQRLAKVSAGPRAKPPMPPSMPAISWGWRWKMTVALPRQRRSIRSWSRC